MRGSILPFPQYVFIARCLFRHRDNINKFRSKISWKERRW